MRVDGEYRIEVVDNIVHLFPLGGFNALGVVAMHKDIVAKAPSDRHWALFEHPCDQAGITPDALDALIESYQNLKALNCVVVAIEISVIWKGVFEKSIVDNVDIPIYLDSNAGNLAQLIQKKLSRG